jgi:hypothetical protein
MNKFKTTLNIKLYTKLIMKKILLSLVLCLAAFLLLGTLKAQPIYQLPNGDFEAPFYLETTNSSSIVPTGFNSFYSASGGMASLAAAQRTWSSTDIRPGSTGVQSVRLKSSTVIGVRANGNLTTGRINAGSMTANNVENYNYTDIAPSTSYTPANPPKFCQQITGTPDSLRFWGKYLPGRSGATNTTDKARIRIYIHGTGVCRDAPQYPSGWTETQLYYGKAMKEFMKEDGGWHCYQVPFEYNGTNTVKNANGNYYLLISMTTNSTPGGGANNDDEVWFDEIEFIYSAWLNDLKVNGVTIDGFHKNLLTYGGPTLSGCPVGSCPFPYQPSDFSWTPEASGIQGVVITNVPGPDGDADGGYTSILVTAEDGVTQKEYRMYYFTYRSDDNNIIAMSYKLGEGGVSVQIAPFYPSQTNYNITLNNPEEVLIPQIVEASILLSDPATAEIQRIEQPTGVNSKGMVVVRAENFKLKSYNVFFTKVQSANANLNWIKVANVDIADFHLDTLEYNQAITTCVTTLPAVTYEKASAWANVTYIPATLTNRTATITVTAENGAIKVYKINFTLTNNNTVLNSYRINTTNGPNNAFTAANNYTAGNSASYTASFTLSLHSTAAQQLGCQGASVLFPSPTVWYPDTNRIWVTAQDLVTKQEYKLVVKNTNCYLKQTSGSNVGLKYMYNGVVRNITVPNATNNNDVTINVTIPVVGPDEPCILIEADPQAPVVDTVIYTQPIDRAGNSGRVRVVANDQVAGKNYIINFTPTISTDATLSYIKYDGIQVPGFNPATELYTLIFPSTTTEVPEIDYAPSFQWLAEENIVYTPAATLADTAIIEVTAENGTTKRTYKVIFEVVLREKDAYLVDIKYGNQSIQGFNPAIYEYLNVEVPFSNPTPPATVPIASSPTAIILESVQLTTPPYTKYYFVYSEDLSVTKIYKVEFIRIKNTNALLADIKINGVSLPDFHADEFDYEFELPYTVLNAPVITATPSFQYANVVIAQIDTVIGTVTVSVTAEDDAYTETYTIDITRELSPIVTIENFSYEYNNETYTYQMGVQTEVTIMLPVETLGEPEIKDIVLADFRAEFEIEEQPDATNNYTGTVIVTAEDLTEETYLISFQRTLSESTLLTGISYSLGSNVYPLDFHPDTLTYYVMLEFNNSITPQVSATAAWVNTVLDIDQPSNPFGQGTILVISEDGQHFVTYTVIFQRKGNCQLASLGYYLDGEYFPVPNFSPTTYVYPVPLPKGTTSTPILDYMEEDNRCVIMVQHPDSPNSTSRVHLVTWNEDDELTYTVNFTVTLSTNPVLTDLRVDGVTISGFNPDMIYYEYPRYDYGTEPYFPVVEGDAFEVDAYVNIEQINAYPGTATVTVTAGDPNYTRIYEILFRVEAGDNNYLKDLFIGDTATWWEFNKDKYSYSVSLPYGTTEFPEVVPFADDPRATIEQIEDGNFVNMYVTAINGEVRFYQVEFIVRGNYNAYASMIYVDWQPLPNFDKMVRNYTCHLPYNYVGKPYIFAELEDPNASKIINQDSIIDKAFVIITAEDGATELTYTITFVIDNSIISFGGETQILVYPNPSSNTVHFELNALNTSLEIFSVEGKKIESRMLQSGINTVHIENLQNGIYFYKIFSDKVMLGAGKFLKH